MHWTGIVLVSLWILGLMIASYLHGNPKEGKYNVFVTIITVLFYAFILYKGGFF